MKAIELKEMSDEQLKAKLDELSSSLFNFRFTAKTGHLDNPSVIRLARKDIARIKTILTQRAKAVKA
ncbi:MAG TPA: 50S ribosomal protein L29 [Fibrobacteraceae bacterium]|nr:50S ribosomal protein L29 [Fibrobacteraceae bacterium]